MKARVQFSSTSDSDSDHTYHSEDDRLQQELGSIARAGPGPLRDIFQRDVVRVVPINNQLHGTNHGSKNNGDKDNHGNKYGMGGGNVGGGGAVGGGNVAGGNVDPSLGPSSSDRYAPLWNGLGQVLRGVGSRGSRDEGPGGTTTPGS